MCSRNLEDALNWLLIVTTKCPYCGNEQKRYLNCDCKKCVLTCEPQEGDYGLGCGLDYAYYWQVEYVNENPVHIGHSCKIGDTGAIKKAALEWA